MNSGVFQVGEEVVGTVPGSNGEGLGAVDSPSIRFRVATANHKYGPFNNPSDFYDSNPYLRSNAIPSVYSVRVQFSMLILQVLHQRKIQLSEVILLQPWF